MSIILRHRCPMYILPALRIVRALIFTHDSVFFVFQLCQHHGGIAAPVALHVLATGYRAQPSAGRADVYLQHMFHLITHYPAGNCETIYVTFLGHVSTCMAGTLPLLVAGIGT